MPQFQKSDESLGQDARHLQRRDPLFSEGHSELYISWDGHVLLMYRLLCFCVQGASAYS